ARSNWYPQSGSNFALYDTTFRYPKRLTLVTPGDTVEDRTEGELRITRHRTPSPIRIAAFNLGEYEKNTVSASGLTVEVYGNRNLDPALRPATQTTTLTRVIPETPRAPRRDVTTTITQTPPSPDPLARLRPVTNDVSAALQYFSGMLGPPPLKNLTVSPI